MAVAASLGLASAMAAPGCVDSAAPDEVLQIAPSATTSSPFFHDDMWCNSEFFFGQAGASGGYTKVRFEWSDVTGPHDVSTPVSSMSGFDVDVSNTFVLLDDVVRVTWTSPGLPDMGCQFVFEIPSGGAVFSFAEMGCVVAPRASNVVINEILANEPGSNTAAEFVELVNLGNETADLGGWTLSDGTSVRHTFATPTTLLPGKAIVVFGGASAIPAGLGNAVAAATGGLSLNNDGDVVTLRSADGQSRAVVKYTSSLASVDGVSMNLSPDGTAGSTYVLHTSLSSAPSSPGVRANGSVW